MELSDRCSNPDVPKALIAMLALGHCMAFIDRNLPAVAAPLLKADLGLTDTQLGVLDGPAFVLLYVAGMLATWPLARSRHRFAVLAGCVAAWAAGTIVFAFGHSFMALVGARALTGLGQAAYVPLALTLIVECVATRWRARSIAIFTAGAAVGRSLSMVLGGATLALLARWMPGTGFAHWRLLCVVMAAPNLVLIVALLCRAEPARAMLPSARDVARQMLFTFRARPGLMCAYLCGAGASVLVVQTVGAWAPSVLHREQGLAPATAAWVFGASLLVAAPMGHFIAGILVDKRKQNMPPTVIIAYALLLVIPLLYLIPRATSATMSCGLLALASLVADIAALAALAGLPSMLRASLHDAGLRVFMAFITVTGVALGPFMTGVVSDGLGMGGHGLSLALIRVCVGAATIGIVAALIARTGWRRAAMEAAA
ncbi:MFS transporter [Dyella monticola]|uniref:MFS transporter n=1 Tax=Dyella monticola TaxID=1927958 RepID=A0A370WZZ8_9GAMM|nr:MFS transporter [Dyella monticola]RDS81672.1 MFS transporter [Dyella monticola]